MPRLLVCRECHTIETLPLFDGPALEEARDPLLSHLVRRHVQLHGEKQDSATLLSVAEGACQCRKVRGYHTMWDAHRDEILGNLKERWTGFHPEFYATKDTFQEDAVRCFNLHRRPKGADCVDYQEDRKRLTPDDGRKKEKHVFLCDFCPVNAAVEFAKNAAAGLYKGRID